jgi:hypothetical protein
MLTVPGLLLLEKQMATISIETKTLLKEHGLWDDFLAERQDKKTDGSPPKEIAALLVSYVNKCKGPESKAIKIVVPETILESLRGKKATSEEISRWVMESLMFRHEAVDMSKAPDSIALGYYVDCREMPSAYIDFKKNFVNKNIGQGKKEDENNFDGKDICDFIDVLVRMNKEAKIAEKKILMEIADAV